MSGPTGIGLAPVALGVPLVPVLLIGAAAAAGTFAVVELTDHYLEQKRLAERLRQKKSEFEELIQQLNDLGEKGEHLEEETAGILERAEKLAQEGKVEEAGDVLSRQLDEIELRRQSVLYRLHERARRVQRKARRAHELSESLVRLKRRLGERTQSVPVEQRRHLESRLADIPDVDLPTGEANREFERQLDTADAQIRAQGELLADLESDLRETMDSIFMDELGHGDLRTISLRQFLTEQNAPEPPEDPILEKLDELMAKIAALRDTASWNDLLRRAHEIRTEPDDAKRTLLYEDLVLDAGHRLKELNAIVAWQTEIEKLLEEAAPYEGTAVDEITAELRDLHRAGRIKPIDDLAMRLKDTQESELNRLDAERRRQAVLESLEDLGYEAHEGLQTALVEGGKLVLRKPNEADYAVEMVTNPDLSVVQTAMVRYSDSDELTEQQRLRDIEKEEAWCQDHAKILEKLDENGMQMDFKLKMAAGDHPVKVLRREKRAEARQANQRQLGN